MPAYSFLDVVAAISGPGGAFPLGSGAGAAKEGISYEFSAETNRKVVGADGSVMNSLSADKSGKITVRLLKTSLTNALLSAMFNFQRTSGAFWGQNVLTVANPQTGDVMTAQQCSFQRHAANTYAEEGNVIEWEFDAGVIDPLLGTGAPVSL